MSLSASASFHCLTSSATGTGYEWAATHSTAVRILETSGEGHRFPPGWRSLKHEGVKSQVPCGLRHDCWLLDLTPTLSARGRPGGSGKQRGHLDHSSTLSLDLRVPFGKPREQISQASHCLLVAHRTPQRVAVGSRDPHTFSQGNVRFLSINYRAARSRLWQELLAVTGA